MPSRQIIQHIETAYPYKCSCPACTNYPSSSSTRARGSPSPNMIDIDVPPPSPATTPVLSTGWPYTSTSTTPPLPNSRDSLYRDPAFNQYLGRGRILEREMERYAQADWERDMLAEVQAYRERDRSENIRASRTPRTKTYGEPSRPTIRGTKGGDHVRKPPEVKKNRAFVFQAKKLTDAVREYKEREALYEDMRLLAEKLAAMKLAANDADNEDKDEEGEWEEIFDPMQAGWEVVDQSLQ